MKKKNEYQIKVSPTPGTGNLLDEPPNSMRHVRRLLKESSMELTTLIRSQSGGLTKRGGFKNIHGRSPLSKLERENTRLRLENMNLKKSKSKLVTQVNRMKVDFEEQNRSQNFRNMVLIVILFLAFCILAYLLKTVERNREVIEKTQKLISETKKRPDPRESSLGGGGMAEGLKEDTHSGAERNRPVLDFGSISAQKRGKAGGRGHMDQKSTKNSFKKSMVSRSRKGVCRREKRKKNFLLNLKFDNLAKEESRKPPETRSSTNKSSFENLQDLKKNQQQGQMGDEEPQSRDKLAANQGPNCKSGSEGENGVEMKQKISRVAKQTDELIGMARRLQELINQNNGRGRPRRPSKKTRYRSQPQSGQLKRKRARKRDYREARKRVSRYRKENRKQNRNSIKNSRRRRGGYRRRSHRLSRQKNNRRRKGKNQKRRKKSKKFKIGNSQKFGNDLKIGGKKPRFDASVSRSIVCDPQNSENPFCQKTSKDQHSVEEDLGAASSGSIGFKSILGTSNLSPKGTSFGLISLLFGIIKNVIQLLFFIIKSLFLLIFTLLVIILCFIGAVYAYNQKSVKMIVNKIRTHIEILWKIKLVDDFPDNMQTRVRKQKTRFFEHSKKLAFTLSNHINKSKYLLSKVGYGTVVIDKGKILAWKSSNEIGKQKLNFKKSDFLGDISDCVNHRGMFYMYSKTKEAIYVARPCTQSSFFDSSNLSLSRQNSSTTSTPGKNRDYEISKWASVSLKSIQNRTLRISKPQKSILAVESSGDLITLKIDSNAENSHKITQKREIESQGRILDFQIVGKKGHAVAAITTKSLILVYQFFYEGEGGSMTLTCEHWTEVKHRSKEKLLTLAVSPSSTTLAVVTVRGDGSSRRILLFDYKRGQIFLRLSYKIEEKIGRLRAFGFFRQYGSRHFLLVGLAYSNPVVMHVFDYRPILGKIEMVGGFTEEIYEVNASGFEVVGDQIVFFGWKSQKVVVDFLKNALYFN